MADRTADATTRYIGVFLRSGKKPTSDQGGYGATGEHEPETAETDCGESVVEVFTDHKTTQLDLSGLYMPAPAENCDCEFIMKLLRLLAEHDEYSALAWNSSLEFHVVCNDLFAWGVSDGEDITDETLPELEQAFRDIDGNELCRVALLCHHA